MKYVHFWIAALFMVNEMFFRKKNKPGTQLALVSCFFFWKKEKKIKNPKNKIKKMYHSFLFLIF